jgi:hypothetical protein
VRPEGIEPVQGKADIVWDQNAELWHCRNCKESWLRNAIARCRCEDQRDLLFVIQRGVN